MNIFEYHMGHFKFYIWLSWKRNKIQRCVLCENVCPVMQKGIKIESMPMGQSRRVKIFMALVLRLSDQSYWYSEVAKLNIKCLIEKRHQMHATSPH